MIIDANTKEVILAAISIVNTFVTGYLAYLVIKVKKS